MKKSFKIEVDCANCANLVEEEVKKVAGVKNANVVFMTQKMKIEFEDDANPEVVMKEVLRVAKKVEPDFEIIG
ncbi:MAG: cation transporter [Prevotella sp.]|nr:cation transporter [Prevotella sp.]